MKEINFTERKITTGSYLVIFLTAKIFFLDFLYIVMNPHSVRKAIEFEYTNWLNPGDPIRNREQVDRFTGDWQFTCPVVEFAHR